MKLHLGCGKRHIPGFIHVDAAPEPHLDFVHNIDSLPMFDDDSADLIYACHVLEHFSRAQLKDVLVEWRRILVPKGVLRLAVPDFTALCKLYLELRNAAQVHGDVIDRDRHGNPVSYPLARVIGHIIGGQKTSIYDFHYSLFDEQLLEHLLIEVGFVQPRRYDHWKTEHAHVDDYSASYYPHMDRTGTLLSLNMEAVKP
jgi:predicted SAM-dependent methyltransferase